VKRLSGFARALLANANRVIGHGSKYTLAVCSLFALVFALRFYVVYQQVGPPSEDLGGDLIVLHTYTQANAVFPHFRYSAPPLYYLLMVLPLTTFFQPLLAQQINDAFTPTLLIFPFYFLAKTVVQDRTASLIASYLFAFSESFSDMMGWGGTLNLFALVFAIPSLYYLLDFVRNRRSQDGVLAAVFLSLTVGAHQLTAFYTLFVFLIVIAAMYLPRVELTSLARGYATTLGLAAVLSLPYVPTYISLTGESVNIVSRALPSAQTAATTLAAINARTTLVAALLLAMAISGWAVLALTKRQRPTLILVAASAIAAALLIPFLNPTIVGRAAYFLPIPIFLLIAVFHSRLLRSARGIGRKQKSIALIFIFLSIVALSAGDYDRLQSATVNNQVIDKDTLQALDWISSHTMRGDTVFTNYPTLGAWIGGYSERPYLSPKPLGFLVTSPDLTMTIAANRIDVGNYALDSQGVTVGDFFPASGLNPAAYMNNENGRQGLFFLNDSYQVLSFTRTPPNQTGSVTTAALSSAQSKAFLQFDGQYQIRMNYSWPFGFVERTVSLLPPNLIHIGLAITVTGANSTSLVSRVLAFDKENYTYPTTTSNSASIKAVLADGETVTMSMSFASQTGTSLILSISPKAIDTRRPTLTATVSSQSPTATLDTWVSLGNLSLGGPVFFSDAFVLLGTYLVRYLVLDKRNLPQLARFAESGSELPVVFENSEVRILRFT